MPSPRRAATTNTTDGNAVEGNTICRKIHKAGFFLIRPCSTRRTNLCKAVFVEILAQNPYSHEESFAYLSLSSFT